MSEKKELISAYYSKTISGLDKSVEVIISAKAETPEEALKLFKDIKIEMEEP